MKIRDRIKEFRRVKASEILPNPKNWRTHPKAQKEALQGLLAEIGFAGAVLARETPHGLMLIDGHLRTETAVDADIPVLILDVDEKEANKILATFDPVSAMAGSDAAALDALIRDVETSSESVASMLEDLAKDAGCDWAKEQKEIEEDEAPEPPVDPITKPGDLWVLGDHRLLCGDSTKAEDVKRLMAGRIAEMMHADPPYGVNYEGGHFHSGDVNVKRTREKLAADESTDIYGKFLPEAMNVVDGPCYLWFAGSLGRAVYSAVEDAGGVISTLLIWHKTNATYAAMNAQYKQRHEPCLYFKPKKSTLRWVGPADACSLWEFKKEGLNKLHPTQKPVELVANALCNHKAELVYDPFLGSGTTLIAAEQLGRKCYGMEISPAYCDVIVNRWEKLTGKKAVCEKKNPTVLK
jgi:DNA modification methylase